MCFSTAVRVDFPAPAQPDRMKKSLTIIVSEQALKKNLINQVDHALIRCSEVL